MKKLQAMKGLVEMIAIGSEKKDKKKMDEGTRRINAAKKYIAMFNKGDTVMFSKTLYKKGRPSRIDYYKLAIVDTHPLYLVATDGRFRFTFDVYDLVSKIVKVVRWDDMLFKNMANFKNLGVLRRERVGSGKSILEKK